MIRTSTAVKAVLHSLGLCHGQSSVIAGIPETTQKVGVMDPRSELDEPGTARTEVAPPAAGPMGARPPRAARLSLVVVGVLALAIGLFASGLYLGAHTGSRAEAPAPAARDFMFQVIDLKTANQGGQTINLFFHYRYNPGIAEHDIPNYVTMRKDALHYLATADLSKSPYWETLNQHLCAQLKTSYPLDAISCELQVVGSDTPGHSEPGYHASIETIGDIEALSIPGPLTNP